MSVDLRERFSSSPIVTSQLCVTEKLLKKSKTNGLPQSSFRLSRPRLYFSIQLSLVILSRLLSVFIPGRPFQFSRPRSFLVVLSLFQFSRPWTSPVVISVQSFSIQSSLVVLSRLFSFVQGRSWSFPVIYF